LVGKKAAGIQGGLHPRMPLIKVSRRGKELKEAQKNEETR